MVRIKIVCTAIIVLFGILNPINNYAQTAGLLVPGHQDINAGLLKAFKADYGQIVVKFEQKVINENNVFIATFGADELRGGDDVIIHDAKTLSFISRNFSFLAYEPENVFALNKNKSFTLARTPHDGSEPSYYKKVFKHDVFDGTLFYFLLGALPLEEGYAKNFNSWRLEKDDVIEKLTPLVVRKKETITVKSGKAFEVWPVSMTSSDGKTEFVSYVAKEPPYLIKQVMNPGTSREMLALEFHKMLSNK